MQSLVVNPNQQSREAPYIQRNVEATREAMGIQLDQVQTRSIEFATLDADDVEADLQPLRERPPAQPHRDAHRGSASTAAPRPVCRSTTSTSTATSSTATLQQVLIAASELDLDGSPNQSWQGRHLINTRGLRPGDGAGRAGAGERPARLPVGRPGAARAVLQPEPVRLRRRRHHARTSGRAARTSPYTGTAGVQMSSFVRRAAFALAFLDYNVLGSGAIEDDSQMLWVRNVRDRLQKLAPFLSYDGDPYPVVLDGRVLWVVDAYTTTSRYPYAQRIGNEVQLTRDSGLDRDSNYVRNSVKAVVDAYDGSVRFYVNDPDDPIVQAWQGAFGDLFTPFDQMPDGLREHLRYPEDLFRVQTDTYSKYQLEPEDFFERDGAWSVAQAPGVDPREVTGADDRAGDDRQRRADGDRAGVGVVDEPVHPLLHDVPRPGRRPSRRSSCCCGRSCRSRAPTSAPSCRRT